MIRYLKNTQIDKQKWDSCINNALNGSIYGYSWYLDIVCEGWDGLVNDDYSTIMPVTRGRKYLMDYIYPPFFTQQLGIFSTQELNEQISFAFYNSIPTAYRFIEMNVNTNNLWIPDSFSTKKNLNYVLTLNRPYEEIKSGYSDHHKRNISKSYKNNLSIEKHEDAETVIEMFRENRGRFITNLKSNHYQQLKMLIEKAATVNMARVWSVHDENKEPCGGAVIFESHQSSTFIFSATTNKGRELLAMYYLLDRYFHDFSKQIQNFDFEGSNNHELARFYKGFGSTEFVYLQIKKNQLPPPWNWFKN